MEVEGPGIKFLETICCPSSLQKVLLDVSLRYLHVCLNTLASAAPVVIVQIRVIPNSVTSFPS